VIHELREDGPAEIHTPFSAEGALPWCGGFAPQIRLEKFKSKNPEGGPSLLIQYHLYAPDEI